MDKMLRVNMTDLTVKDEPFPDEWTFLGGRGAVGEDPAEGSRSEVRPARAGQQGDLRAGRAVGLDGADLRPHERRRQEPAHRRHQGSQLRRPGRAEAGAPRLPRHHRRRQGQGPGEALPGGGQQGRRRRMRECPELKGLRTYAASEKLAEQFSGRAAFVLCGPAGELGLSGASVAFTDEGKRHPARHAARGGLGAAMGAKGLKAIVVDDDGTQARAAEGRGGLQAVRRQDQQGVQGRPAALPVRHLDHRAAGQHDEHLPDAQPPRDAVRARRRARRREDRRRTSRPAAAACTTA